MSKKRITVLGATGSIGTSALDVARRHPDRYQVVGLAANGNADALFNLVREFTPEAVAMGDPEAAAQLTDRLERNGPKVFAGPEGVAELATLQADLVIAGIVGAAGVQSTFAAVRAGNHVGLANKESLVMAGALLMDEVARHGVTLIPVDSEHSAIFQCLQAGRRNELDHIVLTASGGPFREFSAEQLARVTPEAASHHPNWDMGEKITVDSATLMNKGLEAIEARWLFDLAPADIRVLVHPQSIVHSMVAYHDGSVMAQLGLPDMRTPIAYAMSYPERIPLDIPAPDFAALGSLTFETPDTARFPCLKLAFDAATTCGTLPAVLNAANEVAVARFLNREIGFTDIPDLVQATMDTHDAAPLVSLDQVLSADRWARAQAAEWGKQAGQAGGTTR